MKLKYLASKDISQTKAYSSNFVPFKKLQHFSPMCSITFDQHHNQEWCEWDSARGAGAEMHAPTSLQAAQAATPTFPRKEDKASH